MKIGLVGAGRIGIVHAASIAAHPDTELTWVCDPMAESAKRLAGAHGAMACSDPGEILADASVDAIVVGSPTSTHVDLIVAGTRAGKAVLCEKPIDLSVERADECVRQIAGLGARVMLGFNRRFDPSFAELQRRITDGEIGSIEQVTIVSRDPAPPPAQYVAGSGGMFKDMTIHDFDMARFLLGDIVSVSASGQNVVDPAIKAAGDIDGAIVVLRNADGALATIINSRRAVYGYDQRVEAFGSTGMLQVTNHLDTSVRSFGAGYAERTSGYQDFFLERYARAYAIELAAFVDAIENGNEPSPGIEDGRAALALAEAAGQSLASGREVLLNPAGRS